MAKPLQAGMEHLGQMIFHLHTQGFEESIFQFVRYFLDIDNETILIYTGNKRPRIIHRRATVMQVHERLESDYVLGAYLLDPFYNLHVEQAPAGIYTLSQVAPDQFKRTEYFSTYYRRTTVVDEMVYVAYPSPHVSVHLSVGRDAASGQRFSKRELARARELEPVLRAISELHWANLHSNDNNDKTSEPDAFRERLESELGICLTPRQAQVALFILRGHSSVSISLRLKISEQTVKVFRKQLYRKCGISSQAELFSMMMPVLLKIVAQRTP
ncbi:helix-turn-helix transcriptional regulator [uncultured Roseovarius sp.]|uniref:helix-turn-helix transcriptional regulator n=1 Tax=uncultured Roseovarius sp. TaxID=293344 RepID=UPI00262CE21B|nr:helix-turn-helix transcriptional regulator [uncultured Roseovarius sp.]